MLYINAFSSSSDCPRPLATSLINCSAFTSSKSLLNSFPLQYSPVNSVNRFILVKVNSSHQAFHYPRCRSPLALGRTEHQPHRNSHNTVQRWLKIRPFQKLSSVAFKKKQYAAGVRRPRRRRIEAGRLPISDRLVADPAYEDAPPQPPRRFATVPRRCLDSFPLAPPPSRQ